MADTDISRLASAYHTQGNESLGYVMACLLFGTMPLNYNMVGVAVDKVISTMHEKSCIYSQSARKFEKKFQNSVIHTSRNHNDEFTEVS